MLKKVEVTWLDTHSQSGWYSRREMLECGRCLVCRSVGYLLEDLKDKIILVMSEDVASDTVGDGLAIPKKCLLSIFDLDIRGGKHEKEKRTTRKNKRIPNT